MSIGTRLRFEILARDEFRCRYCGARAPDVVLHVDHIYPRAKGGKDDRGNLVTACVSCNLGKRDRLLPEPKNVNFERVVDRLAREAYRFEQRLEARRDTSDVLEEIRCLGYVIHEIGGDHGMMTAFDKVEEMHGFDIAIHLDAHWDGIGQWRY